MSNRVFRFRSTSEEPPAHLDLTAEAALAEPATLGTKVILLRQEPPMSDRDEVIFLLHTAAEIEHALLAQYLYAAYSLDAGHAVLGGWRDTLISIARQEMAHLLSMQNVLRTLGGPMNLEREDHPFRQFYPFPFQLEPFSLASVARYVLAEMPDPGQIPAALGFDLEEVKGDAGIHTPEQNVNRVGALFALLGELVDKLAPADFRDTAAWQEEAGWGLFDGMIARAVPDKAEAKRLLKEVGDQGEGPGDSGGAAISHFRRFFDLYREVKHNPTAVAAIRALPHNPTTQGPAAGEASAAGYIANPRACDWANLFDFRYRLLLADIAHLLILPNDDQIEPNSQKTLVEWALTEMRINLSSLADIIANSPQHDPSQHLPDGRERKAGPPFTLPYTLHLSDQRLDRWRQHEQLLSATEAAIKHLQEQIPETDPLRQTLDELLRQDGKSLVFVRERIQSLMTGGGGGANGGSQPGGGNPGAGFVEIGTRNQFPVNTVHKITVNGEARVLYSADPAAAGINADCPFYVSQLYCWHRHPDTHPTIHCELSGTGALDGKNVTCQTPYKPGCAHGSKYDITDGRVLQGPAARNLVVYATQCVGDKIYVAEAPTGNS